MRKSIIEDKDEFVDRVARDCIAEMTEEEKVHFVGNPNPYEFHFGYGMYIRNKYIHGKNLGFFYGMADDLSHEIIVKIIEIINQNA